MKETTVGSAERRARERETVRTSMLEAARTIVHGEGTAALTMRRIADAIEYAPATLYQYFENRDAIVRALCLEGYGELLAALRPALVLPDPLERLEALGRGYVEFGLAHPETYRLMFMEDPAITSAMYASGPIVEPGAAGFQSFEAIVGSFDALKAERRLAESVDTHELADAFWATIHGVVSLTLSCPHFPATPAPQLLRVALRTFIQGLPEPGPPSVRAGT